MVEVVRLGSARFSLESQLKLRVLRRITRAVQSITACSDPEVWVGKVLASGEGFNSPYADHKWISYSYAWKHLPEGVMFAQSYRYALLIGPSSSPEEVLPSFPMEGLVMKWEGGKVPVEIVEPILRLARSMGLHPKIVSENSLIHVWVLSPVLAGWHYRVPVYERADEENKVARVEGEEAYRQGSLILVPSPEGDPFIPSWGVPYGKELRTQDLEWFFNHYALRPESYLGVEETLAPLRVARPVGVLYKGALFACVMLEGPATLWALDHEPLVVPEGTFYALHPFGIQD
jgi:hypothetical protein